MNNMTGAHSERIATAYTQAETFLEKSYGPEWSNSLSLGEAEETKSPYGADAPDAIRITILSNRHGQTAPALLLKDRGDLSFKLGAPAPKMTPTDAAADAAMVSHSPREYHGRRLLPVALVFDSFDETEENNRCTLQRAFKKRGVMRAQYMRPFEAARVMDRYAAKE